MKIYEVLPFKQKQPTVFDGNVSFVNKQLTSLRGRCPERINGSFNCDSNLLNHLKGGPKIVTNYYACTNNFLVTLEGGPEYVGGTFNCGRNKLTDLHNVHNIIKRVEVFWAHSNDIESHVLGLCLISGIRGITLDNSEVAVIINGVFEKTQDKSERLLLAQEMLIDAGLEPFARL